MSWRRSSAVNYGADAPSCAWNFDWHDVRVSTTEQQGLARGSKWKLGNINWRQIYNVFEWFSSFHDAFIVLMENSSDVCHLSQTIGAPILSVYQKLIDKLVFSVDDAWFPIFSVSAFQTRADKCMLMCWRDLKSEMRQPILSDQSCVTKPEPRFSLLFLHGGSGWPQ